MSEQSLAVYEYEWRKCFPDWETTSVAEKVAAFKYWCATYVKIRHPDKGEMDFNLFDAQLETVESWLTNPFTVALKARQIGFSTLVSHYVFWLTWGYDSRKVIMLSKGLREASDLLGHAKYAYGRLPEWLRLYGPICDSWTLTKVVMTNSSIIESMPSAADPARGSSAFTVVCDELAFLPNSDEAWASIEPVSKRVIMLSTANGEGNLFHKMWNGSQTKAGVGKKFVGIFFPWWSNGRTQEWFDEQCEQLPEWQRAQEYPDNPEEAFLKSGRPVFNLEALRAIGVAIPRRGRVEQALDTSGEYEYTFDEDGGNLLMWDAPIEGDIYVIGADVAMGLEHGDFSTAHVIHVRTGDVVAHWHGHADPDLFGSHVLYNLGYFYNIALLGVENNNHGLTTLTALARSGYPNLYRQRSVKTRRSTPTETLGWNTNSSTKPLVIDELGLAVRDGIIHLVCSETIAEMRTYKREGDGKMHGSPHDDRVMSLAITNQMIKFAGLPQYRPKKKKPGPGTWGHFLGQLFDSSENDEKKTLIGAGANRRES